MVTDENNGIAWIDEDGRDRYSFEFNECERERDRGLVRFAREALLAAGAQRVLPTGQCQHPRPGRLPDGLRPGALGGQRPRGVP